jgi:hypothetical protein
VFEVPIIRPPAGFEGGRSGRRSRERQAAAAIRHRRLGRDLGNPDVAALVARGIPPIAGGAVGGAQAATFQAGPAGDDFFRIAPDLFDEASIANVWSSALKAIPGMGQADGFDLPGRGLLAAIEVVFTGTLTATPGTGAVVATDKWPYGLFSKFQLSANGSPLLNANGLAYEYRRKVITHNAPDSQTSAPSATGANTVEIHWIIPVADNMVTLWGALLSQADDLYLRLDYTQAATADLFTLTGTATAVLTGNVQLTYFAYDVPIVPIDGVEHGILPDTDVLHRFSEYSVPVVGNGDTELRLQQTGGEIERIFLWLDNTAGALLDPASWSRVRFQFAETEEPLTYPATVLLSQNARHYFGKIGPKAAVLDFAYWNQKRDALYPRGVANPKVIVTLPTSITPNAGARLFGVQESLVGGA